MEIIMKKTISKFKNSQFNEIKELFDTLIIEFDQKTIILY